MTTFTPPRKRKESPRRGNRSGPGSGLSPAARRAYERRSSRDSGSPGRSRAQLANVVRSQASRIPCVALILAMLVAGLALTLLLSTQAAQQAYQISGAKLETKKLSETREALFRDVALGRSAPALAQAAGELGMIPASTPAYLAVAADGTVTLHGEPKAASGSPLPPFNIEPANPSETGPRSGSAERELEVMVPIPVDELPTPGQLPALDVDGAPVETLNPVDPGPEGSPNAANQPPENSAEQP
ncbi:hypothetical protein HT102_14800 [Hoyosella sp. G463]|uniref:Cell division protein FtsL n=1 Tax=Lolliginicoccus lacisalsi TaxID=2742202 RepID=A0A927PM14_9ACTN|nr:hypothetical protein [Lolliginicoccus lacisalsi]MBD8507755.1 hypothetical protein [Lolliginicoccus lacisalsi]